MKVVETTPPREFQLTVNEDELKMLYDLVGASSSGVFPVLANNDLYRSMRAALGPNTPYKFTNLNYISIKE